MSHTFTLFTKRYFNSFTGIPVIAWKGIGLSLIESALIAICYYLVIYFVKELHFTLLQSSTLVTCYGIGTMVGALISGKLSDSISPKIISAISLFLQAAAYFCLIYNQNFYSLLSNLFVLGVAAYSFITASHIWVLSLCTRGENERLKAINLLSVASNLGLGLSAILISLIGFINFKGIFFFCSCVLIFMGIFCIQLDDVKIQKITQNKGESSTATCFTQNHIVIYVLICLFLMGILISQFNSTYSLFLLDHFSIMGIKSFSILFIINTLMVVFLQTVLVEIFNKQNRILIIGISAIISGIGMLLLNYLFNFNIAILSIVFLSIGEILFFSISQSVCYERSPLEKKRANFRNISHGFCFKQNNRSYCGWLDLSKYGG